MPQRMIIIFHKMANWGTGHCPWAYLGNTLHVLKFHKWQTGYGTSTCTTYSMANHRLLTEN